MLSLPVDDLLPDIVASLRATPNLVLEAPPGAGKTTRVPPALLNAGFGEILVLEPRRIAARLAARRVAEELGESVGHTAGYQVRFESFAGPKTRIRFLTEGVLTRRLLSDPSLKGVHAVILDEFHERHLEGDLALALLRRLQLTTRPDLRLAVMSATLHGEPVAAYLGGCPVLRSEGRLFPLETTYTPSSSDPLESLVAHAVTRLIDAKPEGDILVFLPGAAEIRRAQRACEPLAARKDFLVLPLHGDLSPEEQDRAVLLAAKRKVILSTNVAESSITIEGVCAVVDSGLARIARDSPWTGLSRIEISRVSQASAIQRAGRAARTAAGHAIRLYTEEDLLRRPAAEVPEILRRELSQLCLDLHAAGLTDPHEISWLDSPPEQALSAAEDLLHRLGALDEAGVLTALGRRMASLPLHPRLAALVLHAGKEGCRAAAQLAAGNRPHAEKIESQLRRLLPPLRPAPLPIAYLRSFPDRVARRRKDNELLLSNGAPALLAPTADDHRSAFFVAADIEERPDQGVPLVRLAVPIEPEWLLDLFPDHIREQRSVTWNHTAERVEVSSSLLYDNLVVEESRSTPQPGEAASLLAEKALEAGLHRFADPDAVAALEARVSFAGLPVPSVRDILAGLSLNLRSFSELEALTLGGGLERAILSSLAAPHRGALETLAPERVPLPSGRRVRVTYYPDGRNPSVSSRLQDFFGLRETPSIGPARTPLTIHLLAPSQRPVQVTQDLAGFWQRLYPQVRRELMRRYPKHAWPENPYNAHKA